MISEHVSTCCWRLQQPYVANSFLFWPASLVELYSLRFLLGSTTVQIIRDTETRDINLDRSRWQQAVQGCHIPDDPRTACHFCVIPTRETRASPLGFTSPQLLVTVPGRLPACLWREAAQSPPSISSHRPPDPSVTEVSAPCHLALEHWITGAAPHRGKIREV